MMIAKLKSPYVDRLNPRNASGDDKKRQVAEAFEALNSLVQQCGGAITSQPGRYIRIECPKGSLLPEKLRELGFPLSDHGSVTRITGAQSYAKRMDEIMNGAPSPFAEYLVFETTLPSGKK
jgi:hypothetical protein